jgi:hypothetical protein
VTLPTVPRRTGLAALALAIALVPVAADPAGAASKHRRHKAKRTVIAKIVKPKRSARKPVAPAPAATPAPAPAATPAPAVTSVISIGGYVFHNLTYSEAVAAYTAAVAAAPAGYAPPAVTSVSVTTTVSGTS